MLITDQKELEKYTVKNRIWQGIPGIEVTKKGRLFVCFYSGGTKEEVGNFTVLLQSDDGVNFTEPVVAVEETDSRCYDPCVWIDPLERLWLIWAMMPQMEVWATICETPDAEALQWSEPFCVGKDVMMNKPTVLSSGEWLFPIAVWSEELRALLTKESEPNRETGAYAYKTTDNGRTFNRLGGVCVPRRSFDEHMILELSDGRLANYVRTSYGIGVSYSYDRGYTWTKGTDSGLGGPCSRFHITRLPSGRVLLINHVNYVSRDHLTALLSEDDGVTWPYQLLLDERENVSYPDVAVGQDGYLYIAYDRERGGFKHSLEEVYECAREVLYAKITEEDIIAGKLVSEQSRLKCLVSRLGRYEREAENPFAEAVRYTNEEFAQILLKEYREDIIGKILESYPLDCINLNQLDGPKLDQMLECLEHAEGREIAVLTEIIAYIRSVSEDRHESFPVVERVKETILEHLEQDLTVAQIAAKVGISRYYMLHLFKETSGITVTEYKNGLKLTKAKKLLIGTDKKITEIAQECGFGESGYLAKLFMRTEKMTPTEYRKLHGRRDV